MRSSDLVLVQGMAHTRATLGRWQRAPWLALGPWLLASLGVSLGLLAVVWVLGLVFVPDLSGATLPGLSSATATASAAASIFARNLLVLALHALACVAGFIAGYSLPLETERRTGLARWVHDRAGRLAIAFVAGATLFSLTTQALILGQGAATLAHQLRMGPGLLLLGLLPHALPELVALFLPLAAWIIASRQRRWDELLAATVVTVAVALPVLATAALVEVFVSPRLVLWLAGTG